MTLSEDDIEILEEQMEKNKQDRGAMELQTVPDEKTLSRYNA